MAEQDPAARFGVPHFFDPAVSIDLDETVRTRDCTVRLHRFHWAATGYVALRPRECAIWLDLNARRSDDCGSIRVGRDDAPFPLGRCGTIAADVEIAVRLPQGLRRSVGCFFDQRTFERMTGASGNWFDPAFLARLNHHDHGPRRALGAIAEELTRPRFAREVAIEGHVLVLLSEVARIFHATARQNGDYRLSARELALVREMIDAELHGPLSLSRIAAALGISRRHFSRSFKASTGTTFRAFVEAERLRRACELLSSTTLPLKAIAWQVGLSGADSLSAAFARRKGMPPSAWRQLGRDVMGHD